MSHHAGVHVHQPHEEMVEHGAHFDSLAQRVALTTAILATIGALFGYQAGHVESEAMLMKNNSIARLTEASDRWSYYQAKSTREFMSSAVSALATDDKVRDKYKGEAERYNKEKDEVKAEAEKLTSEAHALNEEAEAHIRPQERISFGVALLQVSVALASITVLTRKTWLFVGALAFAAAGVGIAGWGATAL